MAKITKQEIAILREEFLKKYCKLMGWEPNELSTYQHLLIVNQDGYLNPIKK
jgi:hypothetical protein